MSAIELAHVQFVDQLDDLLASIATASVEDAKTAHDRMTMAREWAKLQQDAADLAERLTWLEAVILRRIGQLDPNVLRAARRAAAQHFAQLDDAALSSLISDYPARTAVAVYNLWARAQGIRRQRRRGQDFALGHRDSHVDDDDDIADSLKYAVEYRITSVRQAAAVIVEDLVGRRVCTVSEVVEQFIEEEAVFDHRTSELDKSAFRKGLASAVREALAAAPVSATEKSWEIPAYITTHDVESDLWLRVPSEYATVGDAQNMMALRTGQVESAARSLENLRSVMVDRFRIEDRESSEFLRNDTTALTQRTRATHARREDDIA